jgi:endonuclease G
MTLARARLALRQAASNYLFDPNVNLIDFGYPEHEGRIAVGELAIRFHVRKKLSGPSLEAAVESGRTQLIPETIGGFPTDVPEGNYRTQLFFWHRPPVNSRAARFNPLRGGISISSARHNSYATLGALVQDRETGVEMILSNWHVLVGDWTARPGVSIYQPGRLDGGSPADTVATLTRDAMRVNLDAAVAALSGSRPLINEQYELGTVTGVAAPELGMDLIKSGRRTGITRGFISAVEGVARINYGPVDRVIRNVFTIEPHFPFTQTSMPGDSGSAWLVEDTREVVGLHFAGSDFPERALAMDLQSVLDALDVDLVTTAEPERAAPQPLLRVRVREAELALA